MSSGDGELLRQRLARSGRLPIEEALRIAGEVASLGCVVYEMLTGEPPFTGARRRRATYGVLKLTLANGL